MGGTRKLMQQGRRRGSRIRTPTRSRKSILIVARLAAAACALAAIPQSAHAAADTYGHVSGRVVAESTGAPVEGATVLLPDYGVRTTSGRDGSFRFSRPLPTDRPYRRIRAIVTAPGWGRWTIRGVPLYPSDTLILHVELRPRPWEHTVLDPGERRKAPLARAGISAYSETCTGWRHQGVPPPTIRVFITKEEKAKEYDFVFYATHVLPNEWIHTWDADALGAGAVAVKTYGAYRAMPGHAYSGGEGCADVVDTGRDQVFDPTWSTEETDQAVFATLGSILLRDGGLFLTQYDAGERVCEYFDGRMSQWGSQACAEEGRLWPPITRVFYRDTTWKQKRNLLLNSQAESAGTYPWSWTGTVTRVKGPSYLDKWHWRLSPPSPGAQGVLRQKLPWNGTPSTAYGSNVALRCEPENGESCEITISISVLALDGKFRTRARTVTVPHDGEWRPYSFDPNPSGFEHVAVKLVFSSRQTIGVDAAVLTSPYGGP